MILVPKKDIISSLREVCRDKVVAGTYYAPTFMLKKRENHGMGYHCHIRIIKGGGYERAGYLVTMLDDNVYVTQHGGTVLFDITRMFNALKRDVRLEAIKTLKPIMPSDRLPTTESSILLD